MSSTKPVNQLIKATNAYKACNSDFKNTLSECEITLAEIKVREQNITSNWEAFKASIRAK